jgi:putative endonuclease
VSWFLYVIECEDGSLYTGIAVDPVARFTAHATGKGARYTRSHPPRRLIMTMVFPDRSSASKAEYRLKQMSAAEKRRLARETGCPAVP